MKLKENIHYVGVNDRTKDLFEGLWPLPYGVSYNSYLIVDQKIGLIDTVDVNFFELYLDKIQAVIGERPIDYLIINHMEPDHSGSIGLIRKIYPNIRLVGNKKTLEMVEGYHNMSTANDLTVVEGDMLSLGSHQLHFSLIPMVHWPETMVTYESTEKLLFSGDAFGCFGALNGHFTDTNAEVDYYWEEMVRYYSNIVGKYGAPVQRALQKLEKLDIDMICSTHGPMWTQHIEKVIYTYDRLSRYDADCGAVVCYGSMYGNTQQMAESVARGLAEGGIERICVYDVSRTNLSFILKDIFKYRGLVLGSPTYNGKIYPQMEQLLNAIASRDMKNRIFGAFGSFTWAGQAVKTLKTFAETVHFDMVTEPVEMKQGFKAFDEKECVELGHSVATRLLSDSL